MGDILLILTAIGLAVVVAEIIGRRKEAAAGHRQIDTAVDYHTGLRQIVGRGLLTELAYEEVWTVYCREVLGDAAESLSRFQLALAAETRRHLARTIIRARLEQHGVPIPTWVLTQWGLVTAQPSHQERGLS